VNFHYINLYTNLLNHCLTKEVYLEGFFHSVAGHRNVIESSRQVGLQMKIWPFIFIFSDAVTALLLI